MRFSTVALAAAAVVSSVSAAPAPMPLDPVVMEKARAVYKRNSVAANLVRRNNGGGGGGVTDVDIANFALNLEYLEAQFYHIAAYGTQLSQDLLNGTGKRGYVQNNAGNQVPFNSSAIKAYAIEIATDESNHVKALRAALGPAAVAMPELNLGTSFTAAAQAAGLIGANDTFSPYSSDLNFILGAYLFEDVGVTAYNGAAPLIVSKDILAAAAGILAVEAYHAAIIRTTIFNSGQAAIDASNAIAKTISAVDSGKAQGVTVNGTANLVPADANSIAFARTPGEVLDIVYLTGKAGVSMGGFFPNGLNGNLKMSAGAGN